LVIERRFVIVVERGSARAQVRAGAFLRSGAPARRGAVTPWLVLSLTVIVGIVAIGMDGGRMQEERRRAQATADAAALSGAAALYKEYWLYQGKDRNGSAAQAAQATAAANGYGADGVSSVTVHVPPQIGAFAGKPGYIEVIVQRQLRATFGAIFTQQPLTVTARTVAQGQPAKLGIILLNPSKTGALTTTGSASIAIPNAPIVINSSDPKALSQSGGVLLAQSFDITGNYSSGGLMIGPINTGVAPTADPLANLPAPNPAAYAVQSFSKLNIGTPFPPTILRPGVYRGGINLSGGGSAIMMPGIYIIDGGGITISGPSILAGADVMIYNTGSPPTSAGSINLSGSGSVILTPPLSGTYQGISLFQDRSATTGITLSGGSIMSISGTVYAPAAPVTLSGSVSASIMMGAFVCDSMNLSSSVSVSINLGNNFPRVPDITLVE
jgi:hypothetical protein